MKVPPLRAATDQKEKTRKEGEDPVSEGCVEERQVPEHASQQGGGRFIRRGYDFLIQLVTLPELWSQPSFPEFVNWLIRLGREVTFPPISNPHILEIINHHLLDPGTERENLQLLHLGQMRMLGFHSTQVFFSSFEKRGIKFSGIIFLLTSVPCVRSSLHGA